MDVGPPTFLLIVILFAALAAVMIIIMGKWLDLTGYRYKMDTQRNAMNLVQLIVSNSPIVKNVTEQPDKLILDADKLNDYEEYAKIGWSPSEMTPEREKYREEWGKYCDFLDFDHNFTVHDTVTGKNWTIGNLVFKTDSDCYPKRVQGFADLPVVVSEDGNNHPGVAVVRLERTPLSDLSFWLSQAFIRAYWDDYWDLFPEVDDYTVIVTLDPEVRKVSIHPDDGPPERICTHLDKNMDGDVDIIVCKDVISFGDPIEWDPKAELAYNPDDCMGVTITVKRASREVSITYPGG